ncbi:hypothetical protein N9V88_00415 [bacterium]|nr:hypothetical protein [bacterium]
MSEQENLNGDETLHPLEVQEIRILLERGVPGLDPSESQEQVVASIARQFGLHGQTAMPLVDELLKAFEENRLHSGDHAMFAFYKETKIPAVLDAIRHREGFTKRGNFYDRCELLSHGATEFEEYLLEFVWNNYKVPESMSELNYAVKALGDGGGSKSLELLEVVHIKVLGKYKENYAKLASIEDPDSTEALFAGLDVTAIKLPLDAICVAIQRLKSRGVR